FSITEIVPNFLYLGPEITSPEQLDILKSRSIRRILNMAEECDDDIPGLKESFVYCKIPARDTVEMKNVQDTLRTAVQVINTARRHYEPVYVHCKAGKSRSVAVILAYLVLSEKWTLKRAYQLIVKERPGASPNIGFVAELLKLE
ncbi:phosphatases II, partial [Rhizopus microsporus ATCC 52813]